jgi:uncharacterized repeat protein (TIGR02543 family)
MANQTFVSGTPQALAANTFTKTGKTFLGWATSSTATVPTYTNKQVVDLRSATTLYAIWG